MQVRLKYHIGMHSGRCSETYIDQIYDNMRFISFKNYLYHSSEIIEM